jgi:hypothetical protein
MERSASSTGKEIGNDGEETGTFAGEYCNVHDRVSDAMQ